MRNKLLPGFASPVCLLVVLSGIFALFAPPFHNPDANFYYGVALRLSRGQFLASIDGLYSPLLSWLMALPVALGMSLNHSYHFVNFFALALIILALHRLANLFGLLGLPRFILFTLTLVQFLYFSYVLITSDVLAAAINSWICVLLLTNLDRPCCRQAAQIGLLGGLAYLAKALQLPIFLLTICTFSFCRLLSKRSGLLSEAKFLAVSLACCLTICAPWIYMLTTKYGTFAISGQQLVWTRSIALRDYHPDVVSSDYLAEQVGVYVGPGIIRPKISLRDFSKLAEWWQELAKLSLSTITTESRRLFGFITIFVIYLILLIYGVVTTLQLRDLKLKASVPALLIFCQVIVYMNIWGGRFRYYLPIVPALNLFFALSILALKKLSIKCQENNIIKKFIARYAYILPVGCVLGVVLTSNSILWLQSRSYIDPNVTKALVSHTAISANKTPLTGRLHGVYSGVVAAELKREYWNSIDPERLENAGTLQRNLKAWGVTQIIWEGKTLACLEEATGVKPKLIFDREHLQIYLYDMTANQNVTQTR